MNKFFMLAILIIGSCFFQPVITRSPIPSICLQPPPRSEGVCTIDIEGFYYNTRTNECEGYVIGGCRSNRGQSFGSLTDCKATCIDGTRRIQDLRINE